MTGCVVGGKDAKAPLLSWQQSFSFPEARSARTLKITAPDPPTHTWEVRIEQPSSAAVAVRIRTWYGNDFHVFDSSAGSESSGCEPRGARRLCVARFPALEAQRAGTWTLVVEKLSKPPAKVSIEIEFTPLSEQRGAG